MLVRYDLFMSIKVYINLKLPSGIITLDLVFGVGLIGIKSPIGLNVTHKYY